MNLHPRLFPLAWLILPLCACGFLVWAGEVRRERVAYVTNLAGDELKVEAASPTGWAGGVRRLIVPENSNDSFDWIAGTQLMLARHDWRVRHIDYENAPFGHEVNAASPYRWWLGLLAWIDHEISGRPAGLAVERAAILADPLLQLLLLGAATIFTAWRFGALPATLLSIGVAVIFPLAGDFLPGLPDDHGLAQACVLWSMLLLLAGISTGLPKARPSGGRPAATGLAASQPARRWFFAAGAMGGVGLWISVSRQAPILVGIALGGLIAAWVERDSAAGDSTGAPEALPWRVWALGGAATSFGAYLLEYFPAHLGVWQLRAVHPLYSLAWLGGGEVLLQMTAWIRRGKRAWNRRSLGLALLGTAGLAVLPLVMGKTHDLAFLSADLFSSKLTKLPAGAVAASFWAWLVHDGITPAVWAVGLPVLLVPPAVWLLGRRKPGPGIRTRLALALGPALVALGFACRQLGWWNTCDAMLLALLVAATAALRFTNQPRLTGWIWSGFVVAILLPGIFQLLPAGSAAATTLTELEAKALIDRDLAHWLAKKTGPEGAIVLAPFRETAALYFYGGLHGLATLDWENRDGLMAAVRIASATTTEEALELIRRRGVTHIIIPSWDTQLDEYAQAGLGQVENSFVDRLHQWALPAWLRPVPYQLPVMGGMEGRSITILEVVEEQGDALAMSRTAEYFIEMGQLEQAAAMGQTLRRFPTDLGALVALLDVELAVGDTAGFTRTFESLLARLSKKADRVLPWDRRVSLAVVLARGKQMDLAREQVRRCLAEVDEAGLRALTAGSLYRLQVLSNAFGLEISDQRLRGLARDLLPSDLRSRL